MESHENKLLITHHEWTERHKKNVDHMHFSKKNRNNNQVQHGRGRGHCGRYGNYANRGGHGRCNNQQRADAEGFLICLRVNKSLHVL